MRVTCKRRGASARGCENNFGEYDGSPSWLYTSNFQRSFQTALVMRETGLLFSEVRTEFSGLLDPRKMGSLDFQTDPIGKKFGKTI